MATIQGVSRILTVSLTRLAGQAGLASFSLPGIISDDTPNATFGASNRAKKYLVSELSQVGTDFGTSTATYKAANAIVSQSPKVKSFYIIKTGTNVAQEKTITWSADFAAGEVITGTVNGDAISVAWDTDQATTQGLLNTAIAAAYGIDTSAGTANVNTVTSDAGYQVDISISAAGGDEPTATIATSTAGRTIADDISDALAETSTALWYALYYAGTNEGSMWEGTVSAEANELLFAFQSNAGPIKTVATTDIMSRIKAAGYLRTFGTYRETLTDHAPAALISRVIQADNGSITFWGKTLVGVTPDALTSAELAFVEGKNCNNYCYIAGAGNYQPGVCADGTSIQTTWDLDYFVNKLIEKLLTILRSRDKTNFDRDGLALVRANGQGVMNDMVKQNIFAQETSTINAATFTVPDIDDLDAADITAHLLDDCTYDAVYLDGIRKIDVNGNVQIGGA